MGAPKKKHVKKPINLTFSPKNKPIFAAYAKEEGESLSEIVERLLLREIAAAKSNSAIVGVIAERPNPSRKSQSA